MVLRFKIPNPSYILTMQICTHYLYLIVPQIRNVLPIVQKYESLRIHAEIDLGYEITLFQPIIYRRIRTNALTLFKMK